MIAVVVVPEGYASAAEFAEDCGVELVEELMRTSTGFIGIDQFTGQISRYTPPTVTLGAGSATNPQIAVPSTGTAIAQGAVIPAGNWVFVNEATGAAAYVTGNGTATAGSAGFLFAAS